MFDILNKDHHEFIILILLACLVIESCACLQNIEKQTGCKPSITLRADNEHKSKRSVANYGHQAMIGFSCTI